MRANLVLSLLLLLISPTALAHSEGHGAVIEGRGKNGGKLAAVVLATDIDKGAAAPTQAVVEWTKSPAKIELRFFSADRKAELQIGKIESIKLIALTAGAKPEVLTLTPTMLQNKISLDLENLKAKDASTIELILPSLGSSKDKHVVVLKI